MGPIAVLVAAVLSVAPPPTARSRQVRVSLVSPTVEGTLEPQRRVLLFERIAAGLARAGLEVDAQSAADPDPQACRTVDCRRDLATALGARYLVFTRVSSTLRDYDFSFTLVDGRTGQTAGVATEGCSPCGFEDAAQLAERLATQLRRKLEQELRAPATIRIETVPSGALVQVDGEAAGPSPTRVQVEPGDHVARAELDKWRPAALRFSAAAGVSQTLRLELSPDKARSRRRAAGWALVAVGAALSIAGSVLIGLHDRPVRTRCSGSDVDANGNCRNLYNSLPYGIPTLVIGVGMVGGGIGLLAPRRRR